MNSDIPISTYPIYINDQKVGQVEKIDLYSNKIVSKVKIDKKIIIPINSKIYITPSDIFNSNYVVRIQLSDDKIYLKDQDTIGKANYITYPIKDKLTNEDSINTYKNIIQLAIDSMQYYFDNNSLIITPEK